MKGPRRLSVFLSSGCYDKRTTDRQAYEQQIVVLRVLGREVLEQGAGGFGVGRGPASWCVDTRLLPVTHSRVAGGTKELSGSL